MNQVKGIAYARAGLLGNPSDLFGGKTIAFTFRDFSASVTIQPADGLQLQFGDREKVSFSSLKEMCSRLDEIQDLAGTNLLAAALNQFATHTNHSPRPPSEEKRFKFTITGTSNVPYQSGLAGSSAIIIATLRALTSWFEIPINPADLAELALAAEVEDLGIIAGPMDRVIQAYEGTLHMDFHPPRKANDYKCLDATLLPPLFIAWDPGSGESSAKIHNDVWQRWHAGDQTVRQTITDIAKLADTGLMYLQEGNLNGICKLVNKNFDMRASIYQLHKRDLEMIEIGRSLGAATKSCGSGGSILGVMKDVALYPAIVDAYTDRNYKIIRPQIPQINPQT